MRPVQPYFALCASRYFKRFTEESDIAHIYGYTCDRSRNNTTIAIPDGCIDIIFEYSNSHISAHICGTVLTHTSMKTQEGCHYFGIRFMPGIVPVVVDAKFEDLTDKALDLSLCTRDKYFPDRLASCSFFSEQADFFLLWYRAWKARIKQDSTNESLLRVVRNEIIRTCGTAKMNELENFTGYTTRYIDRTFKESLGIPPKTFSRIIRFQKTIDHLNHDNTISLSDLAASHGYFDQPQFIREFENFADMPPNKYRQMIIKDNYTGKFILS